MSRIFIILLIFTVGLYKVQATEKPVFYGIQNAFPKIKTDSIYLSNEKQHSPKKATIYSAILPGLGQAYNRKFWKMPIVYAAIGTATYFIFDNRAKMLSRQNALIALKDGDSSTNPSPEFANIPESVIKAERDFYRTNRDYSIIATAALYLLNIVDAAVDAHFYNFNIDKPLAEKREKNWHFHTSKVNQTPTLGIRVTF